jgi:hypothetical protein
MKTSKLKSILLMTLIVATGAKAQTTDLEKPTIVFVHGIWADGSCWSNQIAALQAKGYHVASVQNPITSLAEDVATTQRAIELVKGMRHTNCTVYGDRKLRAAQAVGVSSATRLIGKSAKPGSTEPR